MSTTMTIRPYDIKPKLNYIGRSQFAVDPLFNGYVDDFRIYNYALSSDDVTKLYNGEEPTSIKKTMIMESGNVGVNDVYDISGKKLSTPQKGLNIINGKKINL